MKQKMMSSETRKSYHERHCADMIQLPITLLHSAAQATSRTMKTLQLLKEQTKDWQISKATSMLLGSM
jgi:nicotinic acid mononucleotide adenylyltransferase